MKRLLPIALSLLVLGSISFAYLVNLDRELWRRPGTVVHAAAVLMLERFVLDRDLWQRPDEVIQALEIRPGAAVADLGAGSGYFVPFLADAVGDSGRVYAVEVDPSIVERLHTQFGGDARVEAIMGRFDDPELPDGTVDLVLLVNTYHHIDDRVEYFSRLQSDLSPDGRVVVIDQDADLKGFYGLLTRENHSSRSESVVGEMSAAGFRHAASRDFLPRQLFEVFVVARSTD